MKELKIPTKRKSKTRKRNVSKFVFILIGFIKSKLTFCLPLHKLKVLFVKARSDRLCFLLVVVEGGNSVNTKLGREIVINAYTGTIKKKED